MVSHPERTETNTEKRAKTPTNVLQQVLALAEKVPFVFVASASAAGLPHLASSAQLVATPDGRIAVQDWFCPMTLTNVQENPNVAIVIWDEQADSGYQVLGVVEQVVDRALLNGYTPELEIAAPVPQVERELVIRIDTVLTFSQAPHHDQPLET